MIVIVINEIFPVLLSSYRFTQIAVDPQIKTPGGKAYDVLFIGTGKCTSHILCDREARACLGFHQLGHYFREPTKTPLVIKILHFIQSVRLWKS
jgi:hypothetical protein